MAVHHESRANDVALREIFKAMDVRQAKEIREAKYKSVDSLRWLADAFAIANATNRYLCGEHHYGFSPMRHQTVFNVSGANAHF
jgi:hypothetical protein